MKKLLLVLVILITMIVSVNAISSNFQTSGSLQGFGSYGTGIISWISPSNGGNGYISVPYGTQLINTVGNPTTYAAATSLSTGGQDIWVFLYDSSHTLIGQYPMNYGTGRYEMRMIGGSPHFYFNGIEKIASAPPLSVNPSYVGFSGNSFVYPTTWDDMIVGDSDNKYIFGAPDGGSFILVKDMINPANSGLAFSNNYTVINAYNMTTTYGYSNITGPGSQNVILQSYSSTGTGIVYGTYATGNVPSGSIAWPLVNDIFNSGAPYGYYYTTVSGTGANSNTIAYIGSGASVAWGSKTYSQGDTATIAYSITNGYFTSGYTYKMAIQDVYGNFINNQTITTQSGTVTNTFTSSNSQGVYYASLYAHPVSGGSDILMNFDYTSLTGYITFNGNVYDAQTGIGLSGALVNISQVSLIQNTTSTTGGNYSSLTGYLSGSTISINVSKSGYRTYTYSFTPLTAKSIILDFSLIPSSPSVSNIGIGGVVRDSTYGEPISGALVFVQNISTGEQYTEYSSNTGWYLCDTGSSCTLINTHLYSLWGSASGHLNSSTYSVVAVGS